MNKFKILAVACLASIAFAGEGGDLWNFKGLLEKPTCGDFCSQVQTPGAVWCWAKAERPSEANSYFSPCYAKSGGWWFGYADEGGRVEDGVKGTTIFKARADSCTTPKDPKPTEAIGTVVIERYIAGTADGKQNAAWAVGGDSPTYTAKPFKSEGHYFIKGYGMGNADEGLDVKFINPAGTDEKPSVAAIGFNWRGKRECSGDDFEDVFVENIKSIKDTTGNRVTTTGLCIRYKADKAGVDIELGWNEAAYEYNTWINKLPAASDWKTVNIKWETFGLSYLTDDPTEPLETALTQAEALKFALKTRGPAETIHFQLKEVGWYGTCSGTAEELPPYVAGNGGGEDPDPIIGGKVASAYKFSFNGRMLSANFAGNVQVVNLQGKVVAQKTLAKDEYLNLSNLPMGIYMVRSESRGIVQKIMVK
ncbi:MAG: T9SS type A sorting domain-containing protein [Fibromonadaceae bacterium]|jgi:hypothetical protein|nr:T9SS type A sorting domain-containing protein [Fibromonadaceae bacterium]